MSKHWMALGLSLCVAGAAHAQSGLGFGVVYAVADNQVGYFATTNGHEPRVAVDRSMALCHDWMSQRKGLPQIPCQVGMQGNQEAWVVVALSDASIGLSAHADLETAKGMAMANCAKYAPTPRPCAVRLTKQNF